MVFKYMVADTDLVKGKVPSPKPNTKPKNQNVKVTKAKTTPKEKSLPAIRKKAKFCLLLMVNIALSLYLYNHFAPKKFPRPWQNITLQGINTPKLDFLAAGKLNVTGIMYYDENPAAIISGKVVYEGDTVQDCKVLKIHKNKVELQKDGQSLTKYLSK